MSRLDNRLAPKYGNFGTWTAHQEVRPVATGETLTNFLAGRAVAVDSDGNWTHTAGDFNYAADSSTAPLIAILVNSYNEDAVAAPEPTTEFDVVTQHNISNIELAAIPVHAGGEWTTTGIDESLEADYLVGTALTVSVAGDAKDGMLIPVIGDHAALRGIVGVVTKATYTDEYGSKVIDVRFAPNAVVA